MATAQDVMLALQSKERSDYNNSGAGKLAAFLQGMQQNQAVRRKAESDYYTIAKQKADLMQSGFPIEKRGGISGVLSSLMGQPAERVNYSNYQSPVSKAMEMAQNSNGQYQLDSFDSSGKFKFKNKSAKKELTPYQQETLALNKQKYADKQEEYRVANENKSDLIRSNAADMLSSVKRAKEGIERFGLTGNIPAIPGSKKVDWHANVDKLKSGNILKLMNEMKNASRTGATGFGQLSNKELEVLQQASLALRKDMRPEDAMKYLDQLEINLSKVIGSRNRRNARRLSSGNGWTARRWSNYDRRSRKQGYGLP